MNASVDTAKAEQGIAAPSIASRLGNAFRGRRAWILLALAIVGAALYLNWTWLVAIGVAPLLIALAPCAVMCALGLCMAKKGGKSCSKSSSDANHGDQNSTPAVVRSE